MADKVKGFASGIVDGIKGFLGIHSPSTVFAEIGDNMALGLGGGFGEGMKGVTEDIKGAIPTDLDGPEINIPDPDVQCQQQRHAGRNDGREILAQRSDDARNDSRYLAYQLR